MRALSSASAFSLGTETTLRETILNGQSFDVMRGAIEAKRSEKRLTLQALLNAESWSETSYRALMTDLSVFHEMCGISFGMRALEDAVEISRANAAQNAETQIESTFKVLNIEKE